MRKLVVTFLFAAALAGVTAAQQGKTAVPAWPKVKVPVRAISHDKDTVVPVEKSRSLIENGLKRSGNADGSAKIVPGIDHRNNVVPKPGEWDFPRGNSEYDMMMRQGVSNLRTSNSAVGSQFSVILADILGAA